MSTETPEKQVKKTSSAQFVFNTLVFALVLMAIMHAFKPYVENDSRLDEVRAFEKQLVTIEAANLPSLVSSPSKEPVMLVIYSSWCGHCKTVMPTLVDLVRGGGLEGFEPVFVSIDDQPRLLSRYLVHGEYAGAFTPYRMERDLLQTSIKKFIADSGSHYRGSIPYIGFFNREGLLISDATGAVSRDDIVGIIKKIQRF
jgi:thiol-disulfide isomerase/thioredoxin